MKKNNITVGIPAYNEEANILSLLKSILNQRSKGIKIEKIIVISDGSTDKTNKLVRSIKNKKIKLFINKKRQGLNQSQNLILQKAKSDILILLDADIILADDALLTKIVKPILKDASIGIVSCSISAVYNSNFYSRIIANSNDLKKDLYQHLPNRNNVYLCNGRVRAFSKSFYNTLIWPDDVPEDAFSYFAARKRGFKFLYRNDTKVNFHPPGNLRDHIMQNKRFTTGKKSLKKYFDKEVINREYAIPILLYIKYIIFYLYLRPISSFPYFLIMFYITYLVPTKEKDHSRYEIAKSSKRVFSY